MHRVLHRALRDAARWQYVSRNVADLVDAPRPEPFEHYVLDLDELHRLTTLADGTRYGPLVRVAAHTGMRLGELLGLTWGDVELAKAQLTVRQARDVKGNIGRPKTARARRMLTLSPETVSVLAAIRESPAYAQDFVFPFTHNDVHHTWQRIRTEAGLPRARFHDLRHAAVTHMLQAGFPVTAVAARVGHSDPSITLRFYAHVLPGADAEIAAAMDKVLGLPMC